MDRVILMQSQSGIAEAMENAVAPIYDLSMFFWILLAAVFVLGMVTTLLKERTSMRYLPTPIGLFAAAVVFCSGYFLWVQPAQEARAVVVEKTRANIQENYDIDTLEIKNEQQYVEHNRRTLYGRSDGQIVEFDVVYSPQYDTMLPVYGVDQDIDVPVKEGSTLDSVLTTEETVEEDAATVIAED